MLTASLRREAASLTVAPSGIHGSAVTEWIRTATGPEYAPISGKVPGGPGGMSIVVGSRCRHTDEVKARALVVVAVLLNAAAAVLASWLLSWPEQAALSEVLGMVVAHAVEPWLALSWSLTGAVLAWLRPRNAIGWLLIGVGSCQVTQLLAAGYGSMGVFAASPDWPWAAWSAWISSALWIPGLVPLVTVLVALYPDGRLPGPRWKLPVAAASAGIALVTVMALSSQDAYNDIAPGASPAAWTGDPNAAVWAFAVVTLVLLVGGTVAIWVMSAIRLAHLSSPQRQQLAWLLVVGIAMTVMAFVSLPDWIQWVSFVLVPIAIGIGVFRYGLLGIESVLRRTLLYGSLTAIVLALYMLVAAVTGSTVNEDPVPALITAALLAVGLTPVREGLQRVVDRLVYGERRDPVLALSHVGDAVAASNEQDLLEAVLVTVAAAVRSPGVAVVAPDGRVLGETGVLAQGATIPLTVSGETVGTLHVTDRTPGSRFGPADGRLLDLFAQQLAVVVHALQLAAALQAERDRVVVATASERDRLRRDLHDGLGPSLTGVGLGLVAAHDALEADDREGASRMVDRVRAEIVASVAEVRRIIDDLRPASLEEAGLASALRRQAGAAGVPVTIEMAGLPALRSEVETAAYRIASEALANVGKHAEATRARVDLRTDEGVLVVTVTDDGRGLAIADDGANGSGVGLASMRHRAEIIGGQIRIASGSQGTTVTAALPMEP